jgi:putative NADH-flavin reductase
MKTLIFGAAGGRGRELVQQALRRGHTVTAYARDPTRIEDIQRSSLRIVTFS